MNLQDARQLIADRLIKMTSFPEQNIKGEIFLAPWDDARIAWEDNFAMDYYDDLDGLIKLLDKACEGTGYFVEFINSVEGHVCKA